MARWNVGIETGLTRRRRTAGVFTDGVAGAASNVDSTFSATRDSVPGDVLVTLPEGERQSDQYWLITETELRTADDNTSPPTLADHVLMDSFWYEVREVVHFPQLIPHYEARIMRIKIGAPV